MSDTHPDQALPEGHPDPSESPLPIDDDDVPALNCDLAVCNSIMNNTTHQAAFVAALLAASGAAVSEVSG
jgi:hypothetical protein